MARKGNPISVRLDLNRSSDSSRFSEGDRESHRMGYQAEKPGQPLPYVPIASASRAPAPSSAGEA
ncbi:hypothetical protein L484_026923 [Morus notabilis]|uniref:Uncharacterized protein n=1 Tax=Morus notabilis TaxID=981085 RepID=W9RBJ7_9ROSA|nr:hypothetical protein L484_026923 [Morus notabilis]